MKNEVIVTINSFSPDDTSFDNISTSSAGKYMERNDRIYVHYEETTGETITAGCLIKIEQDRVEVSKKGQLNSYMMFKQGENISSFYSTPYGRLAVNISTKSLEVTRNEDEINIKIVYDLVLGSGEPAEKTVEINIVPVP